MGYLLSIHVLDTWSLVHLFGFAVLAAGLRRWCGRLDAVLLAAWFGVGWEVVEWACVEQWLGFSEPLLNHLVDVPIDVVGAAGGALLVREQVRVGVEERVK